MSASRARRHPCPCSLTRRAPSSNLGGRGGGSERGRVRCRSTRRLGRCSAGEPMAAAPGRAAADHHGVGRHRPQLRSRPHREQRGWAGAAGVVLCATRWRGGLGRCTAGRVARVGKRREPAHGSHSLQTTGGPGRRDLPSRTAHLWWDAAGRTKRWRLNWWALRKPHSNERIVRRFYPDIPPVAALRVVGYTVES